MTLVYTAAMGLSIGVAAVVARRIGEGRPDAAAEAAVQGIALGIGVAAVVAAVGITLAPRLLAVMGASPAVTAIGSGYTRMLLGGSATVLLLFLINAIFWGGDGELRGAGAHHVQLRQRRPRRLHDRDPDLGLRPPPLVGSLERRRHHGWPVARRREARARRAGGVAGGGLQHGGTRRRRARV